MLWRWKKPAELHAGRRLKPAFFVGQGSSTATLGVARTEERVGLLRWHRHAEQRQCLVRVRIRATARARSGFKVSGLGVGATGLGLAVTPVS